MNHPDVIIAADEPMAGWEDLADVLGNTQDPEQVDVTPDPHRRIIYLAPTKAQGEAETAELGITPVAIVTPRTLHAARGMTADAIEMSPDLTPEDRDTLLPHVTPALATTGE